MSQAEQLGYVYGEQGTLIAEVGSGGANSVGTAQYIYLPTANDPIGLNGEWNRFGYVDGNPLNCVDSEGLAPP